jgi:hypothetical protein
MATIGKLKNGNYYIIIIGKDSHSTIIKYSKEYEKWAETQAKCFNKMMTIHKIEYVWAEDDIKCPYLNCIAGLGLAGRGICFLDGDAKNPFCNKYEEEI